MFTYEQKLWEEGLQVVAGVDEVGRGCFAGPVVVGCVAFDPDVIPPSIRIDDSKKLTQKQREEAVLWIKEHALICEVGETDVKYINDFGIVPAVESAIRSAVKNAGKSHNIEHLLLDAFNVDGIQGLGLDKQIAIIKGDQRSFSIACASIIAKVHRDSVMVTYAELPEYKCYEWHSNKGYGTKAHREAIIEHGVCDLHREQFVRNTLGNK